MTEGVPGWFFELDANDDGQIAMSEFATEWTDEKMAEFKSFDMNEDALLTINEITRAKTLMGEASQIEQQKSYHPVKP